MNLNPALLTNSHIHSPYSFSPFSTIKEMVKKGAEEGVRVLGINDFNSSKGFPEFKTLAYANGIYPLLNMEFLAFDPKLAAANIRINDPTNVGRMYLVGKGFRNDFSPSGKYATIFDNAVAAQIIHIKMVIDKVNDFFSRTESVAISYDEIKATHAKDFVGERHVAKEIKRVFGVIGTEDEIRARFLKQGGVAYIRESPHTYLEVKDCVELIRNAGGLPCYPVLFDDKNGKFTEFEGDLEKLFRSLCDLGIRHIDVIPDRNSPENLNRLVEFFDKKGFFVLCGTEHNTSKMKPVRVMAQNGELSQNLTDVSYMGCCSVASHQNGSSEQSIDFGDDIIRSRL